MQMFRRISTLTYLAWALVVAGALTGAFGYSSFIGWQAPWDIDRHNLAELGSFLQGAVASLWSLAAFVFIYVAFLGQQEELDQSRTEAANQERTAVQQRFENSFFELLGLHRDLRTEINITNPNNPNERVHGSRAVSSLVQVLRADWNKIKDQQLNSLTKVQQTYTLFSQIYQPSIGHYFRNLYHIVVFVDTSKVENKSQYIKILRAQLSSDELLLLFYNGLSSDGYTKFKPLTEKYSLLERVDTEPMWGRLLDREHLVLYENEAFHDYT